MRSLTKLVGLALFLASLPRVGLAQLTRPTSTVATVPGYAVTTPDGAESAAINPSALPFLASWGLAYVHSDVGDGGRNALRGDGFYAATPILFGLAAGVGVDAVRPRLVPQGDRTMVSIALGWAPDAAVGIGAALRVLASGDVRFAGVTSLDLAASWRPVDWLAMTFQARDVVGPRLGGLADESIARSFVLGTALRPFGDRSLTLDLSGAIDQDGRIGGRAAAEVGVPYVGRVIGALEAERLDGANPELRASVGLAVDWGMIGVGGGVLVGDGFEDAPGWYASARVDGAQRTIGVPRGSYVLDVWLEGTGPRGIVAAVRALDRAMYDERVAGVLLRPRGSGIGLAYAQELRWMITRLQERGKRVVCHLDDAAGSEWYACAGADRILLDPAGGVRLVGVSSELVILGDLLRNIGVRADFVRIGEHKSAIEQYMNSRPSVPALAQDYRVLDTAFARLLFDASRDRSISRERLEAIVDAGPHLPPDALELGLAHGLADERDMDDELREGFGGGYPRQRGESWEMPSRWGNRPKIGVVVVDDTITDGESLDVPLIGIHTSGGRTVVRAIERLASDPTVVAIVVRIDSPGGSVLASDQIYRAIVRARERKPVIASMGAVAASGGYYIAAPCHEIWADPTTITGSIGVWFGKVDFAPLGEMIGAQLLHLGRGRHSGATSLYRPFTAEERAVLARSVRHWYRSFLRRVAEGRGMTVAEVDALGRGRLWMGDEAIENRLIDRLGGFGAALASARRAAGVGPEVDVIVVPERPVSLLDYALSALGLGSAAVDSEVQAQNLARLVPELRAALGGLLTLRHAGTNAPLALMPEVAIPR